MQAVNPSVSATWPLFDLTQLVHNLKTNSGTLQTKTLSLSLCMSAKSILLLAIDQADNKTGLSSHADVTEALFASAALLELAEFAVAETENHHE